LTEDFFQQYAGFIHFYGKWNLVAWLDSEIHAAFFCLVPTDVLKCFFGSPSTSGAQQRLNKHEPTIPIDVWLRSVTLAICFTLPTFLLETDKSWDDTTDAEHLGLSENGSMLDDFPANVQINPVGGQLVGPWVIICHHPLLT
jgi:hypothetical protein